MSITTPPTTTPAPRPTPSATTGLRPSAAAEAAVSTAPTETTVSKGSGLFAPKGTKIYKGEIVTPGPKGRGTRTRPVFGTATYERGDGAKAFANLDNQGKIDLLANLARVPGLYAKNEAPTDDYIARLRDSQAVAVRPEDTEALEKVMRYADSVGESYTESIIRFATNPAVAERYFNPRGTGAGRKISLTPPDALAAELEQSFLDYLDIKVDKKESKAYAKRVNDLEKKRGGSLTSVERQQLLLDTIQDKAKEVFKDGIDEQDTLLMRKGALGGTYNILRQAYADYGIPVDDKTLYRTAINSVRSKQALENNLNKVALQAEVAMPALKTYIQQGLTPREALGSYVGLYAKMTGTPESQVNIDKLAPVWSNEKVMPFQDWEKYLYSLPEVQNGPVVRQQKLNDARALIRNFIG